ncbi:MAG: SpaA isopeptide-forming pilin-related protein, partial [Anaerovoracaceae bacterium]
HTLNFFYLERGGNASNCSIEFNIPPTTTDFTFIKAAGDTEEGLPGATFRLEGKDKEGSTIIKDAVSDEFGIVGFMGIPEGEYVLIETDAPKGYYPSDEVYLIRVVPWEPLPSFVKTKDDLFGLCVEYAREPVEPEEPVWVRLIDSEDLWFSNDPIPLAEEQVLTVKKIATGNRAPANAEYEFMIQFFKEGKEDENYYRIVDKKVEGELEVKNAAVEILNLADIVTELQVDGDYQDYYRFYLKHGQQIDFDYGSFFAQNEEEPEAFARDVAPSIPELQFRLIETDNQRAVTTTIAPTGEFGTEIPAPTIEGMKIEGSLGADSEGVVVTYTNAFGNRDKDKDKDKDKDRDKDKDDDLVIPDDPEPQSPAAEVTVPITKVPQLPKTGGLGAVLFLGLGSLMAGAGMYLRRR